jgi:hypothetical protein
VYYVGGIEFKIILSQDINLKFKITFSQLGFNFKVLFKLCGSFKVGAPRRLHNPTLQLYEIYLFIIFWN